MVCAEATGFPDDGADSSGKPEGDKQTGEQAVYG